MQEGEVNIFIFLEAVTALYCTAQWLLIEWSHTRVSYKDLKDRTTLHSIKNSIIWKYILMVTH